jgi:arylsulfatase A-like enzyme
MLYTILKMRIKCFMDSLRWFLVPSVLVVQGCIVEKSKPNFIFILVDDLGWTDLGCYGSRFYETPNLDRLSAKGIKFNYAYSTCPVSSPSRASIFTGKYPTRLNITDWIPGDNPLDRKLIGPADEHQLALEEVTFPEVLKENGYITFFAGKWHLGGDGYLPEQQGFDYNIGGSHFGSPPGGYYSPYKNPKISDGPDGEYLTDRLTDESIKFITANADKPFLVFLSHYAVHTPIQANKKFIGHFNAKLSFLGERGRPVLVKEHEGETLVNQVDPAYASMIASLDENVGRLIRFLEEKKLDKKTYIIFTSDNGGLTTLKPGRVAPTSVRPLRAGKGWCYEGGVRVPLIISGPGIKAGTECDNTVIGTDFYPTILGLASISLRPSQHVDGIDLSSLLLKGINIERKTIFWHYPHYHGSMWTPGAAIIKGSWKLIEFYDPVKTELYFLDGDTGEIKDLSDQYPERKEEMSDELKKLQEETGALFPSVNPAYHSH